MFEICVTAAGEDVAQLPSVASGLRRFFRDVTVSQAPNPQPTRHLEHSPVPLFVTSRCLAQGPYDVDIERGVTVSTWNIEGICRYARIEPCTYLLLCSLLGISQWHVLKTNPLLRLEDLRHPPAAHCLYAKSQCIKDYILILEDPTVCRGCVEFYHCLGADLEVIALNETLNSIRRTPHISPGARRN